MNDYQKPKNGALAIGTILRSPKQEYKVEAVLGMGGFGITYKVSAKTNIQIGNVSQSVTVFFAIKEFFMRGCDRGDNGSTVTFASTLEGEVKQSLQDFITEAKRLNALGTKSQNIVKVNEVFEANDTAYYVMEYLDGGSMESYIKHHGALSWDEAKGIIVPIAKAVGLLHEEKLLHMDIKPDNIMLKHGANGEITPILIDFGIAKHFDSKGKPTSHLMAKGASDGYAPMEQYLGIDKFAPEIDIYALGATMLYLLTGKEPPKASEIRSKKDVLEMLPSSLAEEAKEAIANAMNPSRFERTQSIIALLEALDTKTAIDEDAEKSSHSERGTSTKPINRQTTPLSQIHFKKWQITCFVVATVIIGVLNWINKKEYQKSNTQDSQQTNQQDNGEIQEDSTAAVRTFKVNGVLFKMIKVEGGTFMMGRNENDESPDEAIFLDKPRHEVTLSDYYIGETEVTQALWKAVMGSNPSYSNGDDLPVVRVSWNDCQKFISKLNVKTGKTFSLPTEAEWEYAARGGNMSKGYKYSGSDNIEAVAWYEGNSGSKTHAVGTKQANELGLYDMSGNVYEWCSDWFGSYSSSSQTNPTGPSTGSGRIYRGGCFDDIGVCRVSIRNFGSSDDRYPVMGLRLALRK